MSTYYEYREVKVMIAHRLMAMDGWKVYGYKNDESDSMTDYFSPADWDGIAEKNGYILCVHVYGKSDRQEIRQYNYNYVSYDASINEKIQKLEAITTDRGATESEEITAKEKIALLKGKSDAAQTERYIVTGYIPAHMANPPRCNWHIEKDGVIIAKGNGILKYSDLYYYKRSEDKQTYESIKEGLKKYYGTEESLEKAAASTWKDVQAKRKLSDQFDKFINKLDTTCGGLLGEGDGTFYEKVIVTEYKDENKVVECEGAIQEGQCFILKCAFNYGRYKGLVYRIHESEYNGKKHYHAYKLNRKLTKECTGSADTSNRWSLYNEEKFMSWIEQGAISFCKIETVKVPNEVEKVIKKTIKAEKPTKRDNKQAKMDKVENTTLSAEKPGNELDYTIELSKHTQTNEPLWLVRIKSKLSRDEFAETKRKFASLKGYYSRFTHSFIFKYDPTEKLESA